MQGSAKKAIILMELLVALVLIGAILSLLFNFFGNTLKFDRKVDLIRKEAIVREHLQIRLLHFFTSIVPRSNLSNRATSSLFSLDGESPGLAAVFDNGIDPDPRFSGAVLGELILDEQENLILSITPLSQDAKKCFRKELLLQQVKQLEFQFLSRKSEAHAASIEWLKAWPKDRWDIPPIVRVLVKQKEKDLAFAFSLPIADPITYEKGPA